jgi:four helix bundle protein
MTYKKLKVWQKADELAFEVYAITKKFPRDEAFGITSQLRRAALSVPTNIVEGYARNGDRELARFISISLGSLAEVEYLLSFAERLDYFDDDEFSRLENLRAEVGRLLWTFYRKLA